MPVAPLSADALRWRCDPSTLGFEDTSTVAPVDGVVGQDAALESLRFGLEIDAQGQNVFVRGLSGTGRLTLVRRLLERIQPHCPLAPDRVFVHNFGQPERPRLLTLPRGMAAAFQREMEALVHFIGHELGPALNSQLMRSRRADLDARFQAEAQKVTGPFDEELRARGLGLVPVQQGEVMAPTLVPLIDGQPVPPEKLGELHQAGHVSDEQIQQYEAAIRESRPRLEEVSAGMQQLQLHHHEEVMALQTEEARRVLQHQVDELRQHFPGEDVAAYLGELVEDVVTKRLTNNQDGGFLVLYRVNIVAGHPAHEPCPVLVENVPSLERLAGVVEPSFGEQGQPLPAHMGVKAGSLLRADGGYLVIEAKDVAGSPGAWTALKRTLRSGQLEMVPPDLPQGQAQVAVRPEPVPLKVKVVLLGDSNVFHALSAMDEDFPHLFKVLADFEDTIPRNDDGLQLYAGVLARIAKEEGLPPFGADAVAALAEHGSRIAGQGARLTARFGRVADLAREAVFLARGDGDGAPTVTGDDVRLAVTRTKQRADLPARRFRRMVAEGNIKVRTRGAAVGEANGLAVISAGPLAYGFPTRITATVGPGTGGAVNVEHEAELSGAIHTKSFYILGGLLRRLLRADHPLAYDGSVVFEQTYGGIDGDSASGIAICCLLSALTDVPLRQDLAMTGAIDQVGNILPIGAANEKVEGFFDICRDDELTGTQGVIVPKANASDLMLRHDVVEACREGRFHVYAVDDILETLELLTGVPTGERDASGQYPADSLLGKAVKRVREFWEMSAPPGSMRS